MEGYIFEKLKIMGWTSVVLEIMKLSSAHIPEIYYSDLSHMRKPVYAICEQQMRRSACASAQSDQRLCCSLPR